MTWGSFLEYVTMRELGQEDAIYRNYDLTFYVDRREPGMEYSHVRQACGFMGISWTAKTPLKLLLDEVRARLRSVRFIAGDDEWLEARLNEWYVWHRIRTGQLRTWRKRGWNRSLQPRAADPILG